MDIYQILAIIAGMIIVVAGIPQIIRIVKVKESKDVSIWMFILFLIGQIIWLSYGLHLGDIPLIISNALALFVTTINIYLIARYRHG